MHETVFKRALSYASLEAPNDKEAARQKLMVMP
jgi:hypothetical protein